MSILRVIALGASVAASTVLVCFVSADRLAHSPDPAAARLARAAPAKTAVQEPAATGTITQGAEAPPPVPARMPNGFDTERLNALMRGDAFPAPARKR